MQTKKCADCGVEKVLDQFGPTKQQLKFGVKSRCRECEKQYKRDWVQRNPEKKAKYDEGTKEFQRNNRDKVRAWNTAYRKRITKEKPEQVAQYQAKAYYKRRYKVTLEWRNSKIAEQNGLCKICGRLPGQKGLMVDHCHTTGKVRQLLCGQCNMSLHKLENDYDWVMKATAYVKENSCAL